MAIETARPPARKALSVSPGRRETIIRAMAARQVPTVVGLLWPTLQAVREVGGSGTLDEIDERVVEREEFTEEQQAILHNEGPRTKIEYRLAWARTYLKGMGLLENSERGVWAVTEAGRAANEEDVARLHHDYRLALREARRARSEAEAEHDDAEAADEELDTGDWKGELLEVLLDLTPERFEHLSRRPLRRG